SSKGISVKGNRQVNGHGRNNRVGGSERGQRYFSAVQFWWRTDMTLLQLNMRTPVSEAPVRGPSATIFEQLAGWEKCAVEHLKPNVPSDWLQHRQLRTDEFWRRIPAYKNIETQTFLDHAWQSRNSATSPARLFEAVGDLASPAFREDVAAGCRRAPM